MTNYKHDYDRPPAFQWFAHDPDLSGQGAIAANELKGPAESRACETPSRATWTVFWRERLKGLGEVLKGEMAE